MVTALRKHQGPPLEIKSGEVVATSHGWSASQRQPHLGRCWRVNEDVVPDRADGFGRCRWVGRVGKERRAPRDACRVAVLRAHKHGLFVPSTSVGPVGQLQEENYTCVGIAVSRNHIKESVPVSAVPA